MKPAAPLILQLILMALLIRKARSLGDFVDFVECRAYGVEITLKRQLPIPKSGYWDLEVENYPECPAGKTDVGGGHKFIILFDDKKLCGVFADSIMTPSWVTRATVTLILKDDNDTVLADSVACYYDTNFESTLQSFRGEITSENMRYGGSLQENEIDVETTVYSSEAVDMDFYDRVGRPLQTRSVQLGDPILFKLQVEHEDQVSRIMPETCYFSSSSLAQQDPLGGQTLPFVKKGCFNSKDGMVRAFLPKMERDYNGTMYQMRFPAFHFTGHGENLFVHCTILACIGNQQICEPKSECFGLNRRRRRRNVRARRSAKKSSANTEEVTMTKFIVVEDKRHEKRHDTQILEASDGRVCMDTERFVAVVAGVITFVAILLAVTCCMLGRLWNSRTSHKRYDKYFNQSLASTPPSYSNSVQHLPVVASF